MKTGYTHKRIKANPGSPGLWQVIQFSRTPVSEFLRKDAEFLPISRDYKLKRNE